MSKTYHPSCDRNGVCQGLGANRCPDCDYTPPAPTQVRAQYPFAPGVIHNTRDDLPITFAGPEPGFPYTLRECLAIFALVLLLSFGAGYLVELLP